MNAVARRAAATAIIAVTFMTVIGAGSTAGAQEPDPEAGEPPAREWDLVTHREDCALPGTGLLGDVVAPGVTERPDGISDPKCEFENTERAGADLMTGLVWGFGWFTARATIAVAETAATFAVWDILDEPVGSVAASLETDVLRNPTALTFVSVAVAVAIIAALVQRNTAQAWREFVMLMLVSYAAVIYLADPAGYYRTVAQLGQQLALTTMTATDPAEGATISGTLEEAIIRTPWEVVSFGDGLEGVCVDVGTAIAEGRADDPVGALRDAGCDDAADYIETSSVRRAGVALFATFATVATSVWFLALSVTLLAGQALLAIVLALGPLTLLAALVPWSRGTGAGWVAAIFRIFAGMIAGAAAFGVSHRMVHAFMTADGLPAEVRMTMSVGVIIGGLMFRRHIVAGGRTAVDRTFSRRGAAVAGAVAGGAIASSAQPPTPPLQQAAAERYSRVKDAIPVPGVGQPGPSTFRRHVKDTTRQARRDSLTAVGVPPQVADAVVRDTGDSKRSARPDGKQPARPDGKQPPRPDGKQS